MRRLAVPLVAMGLVLTACSSGGEEAASPTVSDPASPTSPEGSTVTLAVGSATPVSLGCEVGSFDAITPWDTEMVLTADDGELTLTAGDYVNGPVPIKAGELLPRAAVTVDGTEYELVAAAPIADDIGTNQRFSMPPLTAPFTATAPDSADLEYMLLDHTVVDITCSADRTPNTPAPTPVA